MECNSEYFIFNSETKNKREFDEKYIYQGKSVYEVIKVKDGIPIFLEDHMDRVLLTLKLKKLELFISIDEIVSRIRRLISVNDIKNLYLPMGFSNFKIEGRGLGSALILEFLLYYMTKPEYQLHVREEIYLDAMLDLF